MSKVAIVAGMALVGGQIGFDGKGNLHLSTGDDTNPFESGGYAPIDDDHHGDRVLGHHPHHQPRTRGR